MSPKNGVFDKPFTKEDKVFILKFFADTNVTNQIRR